MEYRKHAIATSRRDKNQPLSRIEFQRIHTRSNRLRRDDFAVRAIDDREGSAPAPDEHPHVRAIDIHAARLTAAGQWPRVHDFEVLASSFSSVPRSCMFRNTCPRRPPARCSVRPPDPDWSPTTLPVLTSIAVMSLLPRSALKTRSGAGIVNDAIGIVADSDLLDHSKSLEIKDGDRARIGRADESATDITRDGDAMHARPARDSSDRRGRIEIQDDDLDAVRHVEPPALRVGRDVVPAVIARDGNTFHDVIVSAARTEIARTHARPTTERLRTNIFPMDGSLVYPPRYRHRDLRLSSIDGLYPLWPSPDTITSFAAGTIS